MVRYKVVCKKEWLSQLKGLEKATVEDTVDGFIFWAANHRQADTFAKRLLVGKYGKDWDKYAYNCGILITPIDKKVVITRKGIDYEVKSNKSYHFGVEGETLAEVRVIDETPKKDNASTSTHLYTNKQGHNKLTVWKDDKDQYWITAKGGEHPVSFSFDRHQLNVFNMKFLTAQGIKIWKKKRGGFEVYLPAIKK